MKTDVMHPSLLSGPLVTAKYMSAPASRNSSCEDRISEESYRSESSKSESNYCKKPVSTVYSPVKPILTPKPIIATKPTFKLGNDSDSSHMTMKIHVDQAPKIEYHKETSSLHIFNLKSECIRVFPLPSCANNEAVQADYCNKMLKIYVPLELDAPYNTRQVVVNKL